MVDEHRELLDVLQTLPQLVYIIPFIYLMPVSIVARSMETSPARRAKPASG